MHSFTGTEEEMWELVEDGWSIGVNGCSLKTKENCDVVAKIPLKNLMLETDGPVSIFLFPSSLFERLEMILWQGSKKSSLVLIYENTD